MHGSGTDAMKCHDFDRRISAYLDGQLTETEHKEISLHLSLCEACAAGKQNLEEVRSSLRNLASIAPPAELATSLRVIASKERARRAARASAKAMFEHWKAHARLWVNNLMRPLAIPAVGGLVSAVMLFSMLVPTFTKPTLGEGADVPTPFYSAAKVKSTMAPFGLVKDELFVDVTIDENGRMVEYSIPKGQPAVQDRELIRTVETHLLFTEFTPATTFGQPMYGKIRVYIRRSSIEVRG